MNNLLSKNVSFDREAAASWYPTRRNSFRSDCAVRKACAPHHMNSVSAKCRLSFSTRVCGQRVLTSYLDVAAGCAQKHSNRYNTHDSRYVRRFPGGFLQAKIVL